MRKQYMRREEEGSTIRHPAIDIMNVLNPINHASWWYSYLNPVDRRDLEKHSRKPKRVKKSKMSRQTRPGLGRGEAGGPTFLKKGKGLDN